MLLNRLLAGRKAVGRQQQTNCHHHNYAAASFTLLTGGKTVPALEFFVCAIVIFLRDDCCAPVEESANLIIKFKFDATQERLDNLGQPRKSKNN